MRAVTAAQRIVEHVLLSLTMNQETESTIATLSAKLAELAESFETEDLSNRYVASYQSDPSEMSIVANREGLVYLASVLMSLAAEASGEQCYHFDSDTVLSECELPFTIGYEAAPWEDQDGELEEGQKEAAP